MPIDTTPSTVATSALNGLPFDTLIAAPLDAAIKAEAKAAQTSWEFIKEVGLQEDNGQKKAVTVDFIYTSNGREVKLIVPLLAIVPIPYISVDDITIDFKANISASSTVSQEDNSSQAIDAGGEGSVRVGWGPFSAGKIKLNANYSSKKDSKATQESKYSVEYTMDIHVGASQADMPAGLATILNILQSSITPTIPNANLQVSPKSIDIDPYNDSDYTVNITAFDNNGLKSKNLELTIRLNSVTAADDGISISNLVSPQQLGTNATAEEIKVTTDNEGSAKVKIPVVKVGAVTQDIDPKILQFKITGTLAGDSLDEVVPLNIPRIPKNTPTS